MSSYAIRGGTVLAYTGAVPHLHIVCSDPAFYPEIGGIGVLVVNISSVKEDLTYDSTCVLHAGEHPFVVHDSYVVYAKAVVWKLENIEKRIESGEVVPKSSLAEPFISNIISGFFKSPFVARRILKFCQKHCEPRP